MAMAANEIEALIKAALPDARVTVEDLAGDGDHYAATVVSARQFRGIPRVQAAPDRLRRAARPNGGRAACPRIADLRPGLGVQQECHMADRSERIQSEINAERR